MRILIVEDEIRLAKNIAQVLTEKENFVADIVHNGIDGLHMIKTEPYDLVILDLMLPGMDGMDILRQIRKKNINTPILVLTARNAQDDIIQGLNTGCDDYLTKPFDIGELTARCKALIRRSYGKTCSIIKTGNFVMDLTAHKVEVKGKRIGLTAMEYRTLEYLAMRKGQVVSKEELLEHLYDFNWEKFSNVIEVYISMLRKKIDPGKTHDFIKTIRNQGYLLEG
jgi:two-component system response regulator PhoP